MMYKSWAEWCAGAVGTALMISSAGCALDASAGGDELKGEGDTGSTQQPIANSSVAYWNQGDAPKLLSTDTQNTVCFLAEMTGKFRGFGESIKTVRVTTPNASHPSAGWYLEGGSGQVGIQTRARCIATPFANWSWEVSWPSPTGGNVQIGVKRACFLTRIEGDFQGGAEFLQLVRTPVSGTSNFTWSFNGGYHSTGVRGGAICLDASTNMAPMEVGGNTIQTLAFNVPPDSNVLPTQNVNGGPACFLTHVQGKFSGGGETIVVFKYTFGIPSQQTNIRFDTRTSQPGMLAGAGCVL